MERLARTYYTITLLLAAFLVPYLMILPLYVLWIVYGYRACESYYGSRNTQIPPDAAHRWFANIQVLGLIFIAIGTYLFANGFGIVLVAIGAVVILGAAFIRGVAIN